MFLGEHPTTLDSSGRFTMPFSYRKECAHPVVVPAPGLDECLCIFPRDRLEQLLEVPKADGVSNELFRRLERAVLARCEIAEPDVQGRVRIPARLRCFAQLQREITLVGVNERIEVWDTHRWNNEVLAARNLLAETVGGIYHKGKDRLWLPEDAGERLWLPQPTVAIVDEWKEIAARVAEDTEVLDNLDWRKFEDFVAHLLQESGWSVEPMGYTKDGGIDIIAVRKLAPDVEIRMMVQCKRLAKSRRVGVQAVREVWSVKWQHGFHQAMIATTSSFTRGAVEEADKWHLDLKDREALVNWCRKYGTGRSN